MRPVSLLTLALLVISVFSAPALAEKRQTITQLELRDRIVKITATSQGLNYSILSQDGTMLDANLSEDRLAEQHPELYERIRPAIANDTDSDRILWMGDFPTK